MRPVAFSKAAPALIFAAILSGLCFTAPAGAASRSAVLSACDHTERCGYSKNKKNGDISGCSINANTCFYCPNDGKKQCFSIGRQLPPAGKMPANLGNEVVLTK